MKMKNLKKQPINVLSTEVIAIYVRVSTDDQLKGYSIEGQIEDCIKKAGTKDVLIYTDDGYTGEILNRPGLMRLQEDIEKGLINKVICYDPDRLSRKLFVQLMITQHFQKHNVVLEFVNTEYQNTPEGQMYFQIRGAFSEFDKAKIKHNTMTGRYRKAKKGLVVKNNNLYGYDYDKDKNTYTINEDEAKIVKMIFDYFTNPESPFKGVNGIAKHLTEIGIPTKRRAKVWHRQVVRQILLNEAYTGTYYQNRYDTVGNYVAKQSGEKVEYNKMRPKEEWLVTTIPSIITNEQFDYAQELLKQSRRRHTKDSFHKYLLSGLVRCGKCGATMTGRKTLSHGKDFFIYTARKNYAGNTTNCTKQMSENKLNKIVWEHLIELFNNPERLSEFNEEKQENNYTFDELSIIETEIEKTKKGRKRLIQLISLDEELELEEIKDQIRELQIKEKDLKEKYTLVYEQITATKEVEPNQDLFKQAIDLYFNKKEKEFSFEDKQNMIRMIVKEVLVFDKDTVEIHLF